MLLLPLRFDHCIVDSAVFVVMLSFFVAVAIMSLLCYMVA